MARASRADAARHHQELIDAASRLFRERGVDAVGLADLMGAIGLSRGGFYKHFKSKEALVAAAVDAAFEQHLARIEGHSRAAFLDFCLSPGNRDDAAVGCPSPFVTDVAHTADGTPPREAFVRGTHNVVNAMRETTGEQQDEVLADLAITVGAVLLARATAGDPISDAILTAARRRLG